MSKKQKSKGIQKKTNIRNKKKSANTSKVSMRNMLSLYFFYSFVFFVFFVEKKTNRIAKSKIRANSKKKPGKLHDGYTFFFFFLLFILVLSQIEKKKPKAVDGKNAKVIITKKKG